MFDKKYDSLDHYLYHLLDRIGAKSKDKMMIEKLKKYIDFIPDSVDFRIADTFLVKAINSKESISEYYSTELKQYRSILKDEQDFNPEDFYHYCYVIKELSVISSNFGWLDLVLSKYTDIINIERKKKGEDILGDKTYPLAAMTGISTYEYVDDLDDDDDDNDDFDLGMDDRDMLRYFELNPWETHYVDSCGITWDNPFYDDDY